MKKSLLLVVVLVSLFAVRVSAIDLSYNLKVGSSYIQSTKTSFKMGMNVMGQTMDIVTTVGSHITYTVKSVKDTCYELDVRYDSVEVLMNGLTGNQILNSGLSSAQGQVSDVLKSFVNKTFQLTLSKKGKVVDVRNYEALFSAMESAGQSGQDPNAQISTQLKQNFSKEAFLSNMEAYVSFFPATSINKGESWTCTNNIVTSGFPIESKTTYTLTDVTTRQYIISGVSSVKTSTSGDAPLALQGINASIDIKGGITYEMKLDRNTGWLNQLMGKINMDATVNMEGEDVQGQNFTMKITGDVMSNDR